MKFIIFIVFLSLHSITTFSQNVGINNPTPSEKLDVNGNINLSGDLKLNGNAGLPGQILSRSSTNSLSWSYPSSVYTNNFTIINSGGGFFTVPASVTRIFVQIWGAGGGGSTGSANQTGLFGGTGGGGGGYIQGLLSVTPNQTINYYVGNGGGVFPISINGSLPFYFGYNGDSSFITINSYTLYALGGMGANSGQTPPANSVNQSAVGGGYRGPTSINSTIFNFCGLLGDNGGYPTMTGYATTTGAILQYGNGGNGANTLNTGGIGWYSGIGSFYASRCVPARQPGGGGAAEAHGGQVDLWGQADLTGGKGMIIFWW